MNPSTPPSGQPLSDTDLAVLTWIWVAGLSMLGGVASFLQKMKTGHVRAWNFTEFVGEITASGLTGIITANLCDAMNVPAPMKYALVGISSHMGSRALFKLEALFSSKFNLPADEPEQAKEAIDDAR
jgi:hypothetical protein